MFTVELYAKIRHVVMVDGLSRREAAKRFGVHRNTITKMLSFSVPPGYRRRERPASRYGLTWCVSLIPRGRLFCLLRRRIWAR
jgi:transposase